MGSLETFLIVGIVQGAFLIVTLQFVPNRNQHANNTLTILLFATTTLLSGALLYYLYGKPWAYRWDSLFGITLLLFGPLSYSYIIKLYPSPIKFRLSIVHYVLPLFFFTIFLYHLTLWDVEVLKNLHKEHWFFRLRIQGLCSFISVLFYFIAIVGYLRSQSTSLKSERPWRSLSITFLIITMLFLTSLWQGGMLIRDYFSVSFKGYLKFLWITIPIIIYLIAYLSIARPDFLIKRSKKKGSQHHKRLDENEVKRYRSVLEQIMLNDKIYQNQNLALSDLAQKLRMSTHDLSWLLNKVYGYSFYDYINELRIQDFIKQIESGAHQRQTFLAVAHAAGFKSKSTFNRAFKKTTNLNPREYIDKMRPTKLGSK